MASGEEGLFDFLPERGAGARGWGVPRLRFAERMQTRWRPVSLDGPDDHRVRLVWSSGGHPQRPGVPMCKKTGISKIAAFFAHPV
jgi:hypothetical protein